MTRYATPMDAKPLHEEVSLLNGGGELLDRVEPLWLQLRRHHAEPGAAMERQSLGGLVRRETGRASRPGRRGPGFGGELGAAGKTSAMASVSSHPTRSVRWIRFT